METKKKEHCPNKAQFIVPWAGKLYKYCEVHANGICTIGEAMGSPIQVQSILPETFCEGANDLDEYKTQNP